MTEYSNSHTYQFPLTVEFCEATFAAYSLPSSWAVKIYHICLSLISMASIFWFAIYHRRDLKFHFNIKILFYSHFIACFVHSAIIAFSQTHHLIVAMSAQNPCDVVLSPIFYALTYVPFLFSLFFTGVTQVLMVAERTIAAHFFTYYEKMTNKLGIAMAGFTILWPILVCLFLFYDETFDYPVMSFMATSPKSGLRINSCFVLFIIFYAYAVFHSIALYRFNEKRNGLSRSETTWGLSSKYQMSENVNSSRVLWHLISTQLSIFLIYGIFMFCIRMFTANPRPANWVVITELCYTPPIYCAIMPILCILTLRRSRKERTHKIDSIVSMRSTGMEGWDNYQKMLQDQWA